MVSPRKGFASGGVFYWVAIEENRRDKAQTVKDTKGGITRLQFDVKRSPK